MKELLEQFIDLYMALTDLALYYTTFFGAIHFAISCFLLLIVLSPLYFIGKFLRELLENIRGGR